MRVLLEFIGRHSSWVAFTVCAGISLFALLRGNPYQQAVFMTSAGRVASGVYSGANSITGYFYLRSINDDLQQRLALLELENISLRQSLQRANEQLLDDSVVPALAPYEFITARVINNSLSHPNNFLTLNRGAKDGIEPEMGVFDQNGIVGIVNVVGPHTARVISVLNSDLRLSCKVKGSDAFGSLVWDGRSPRQAILEELPRHVEFRRGDTVITSGYSVVFPEGIPVGTIVEQMRDADDNFYSLRIDLLTDFAQLSTVRVIRNFQKDEIQKTETDAVNKSGKF